MGQKVRPTGFRTGIMVDWQSHWYANKQDFAELLVEDVKIRKSSRSVTAVGHLEDPHPADPREGDGVHPLGPRRHDHRQEGAGSR